jgi:hypothetical protein
MIRTDKYRAMLMGEDLPAGLRSVGGAVLRCVVVCSWDEEFAGNAFQGRNANFEANNSKMQKPNHTKAALYCNEAENASFLSELITSWKSRNCDRLPTPLGHGS